MGPNTKRFDTYAYVLTRCTVVSKLYACAVITRRTFCTDISRRKRVNTANSPVLNIRVSIKFFIRVYTPRIKFERSTETFRHSESSAFGPVTASRKYGSYHVSRAFSCEINDRVADMVCPGRHSGYPPRISFRIFYSRAADVVPRDRPSTAAAEGEIHTAPWGTICR